GKSELVAQATQAAGADILVSHPAVQDPTDQKGFPWFQSGMTEATFVPFGDLATALNATKPLVWFLDDFGQGTNAVQASYMQLVLAKRIGQHVLPPHVTFVIATNRRGDKAGVQGVLEPVKTRCATIIAVEPDLDDWCAWAYQHDVPGEVIAFLRFK